MKWINLTKGQRTCVDDDVFEWASCHKWYARKYKHGYYAMRHSYPKGSPPKTHLLHREILGLTDPLVQTNHVDGNGLNNLRKNIGAVTNIENSHAFRSKPKATSSRFRGVNRYRRNGKWQARIAVNGVRHTLGLFDSESDAARARDVAALRFYGPIAQINLPN
jgi:hypothetical protein